MMNENERAELEAENDGYRNEWQRAMAWSKMQPHADDRCRALELVRQGKFVAVEISPRYCQVTDAILGDHCHLLAAAASRAEVAAMIPEPADDEARVEIWPHHCAFEAPCRKDDDSGVPF